MIDTTLVPLAYGFLVLAAISLGLAAAGIVVALRELRGPATPVLSVSGPAERSFSRAA